ncbi:MAG: hypothetical protein ACO2PO_14930 [Candidatus Calescibacterium sp.]
MIWIALPVITLIILISRKKRGLAMDLKSMIMQANERGGGKYWDEKTRKWIIWDTPPTEFGKFLGVYRQGNPNSDIPTTVMSISQFADIVKRTIGIDTTEKLLIARSIVAIAIREQLIRGQLIFPDNNPFGFNAFKNSWKSIRQYINGIFLAKDLKGWVWFLSFYSLQDAVKAIATILQSRDFHRIQSPDDFARLYIRRWWSPTKDEKELQKIIQKETPNLVAIWNQAKGYVG